MRERSRTAHHTCQCLFKRRVKDQRYKVGHRTTVTKVTAAGRAQATLEFQGTGINLGITRVRIGARQDQLSCTGLIQAASGGSCTATHRQRGASSGDFNRAAAACTEREGSINRHITTGVAQGTTAEFEVRCSSRRLANVASHPTISQARH